MKLDQSDGRGTNSFSICRPTGRWPFLRLVLLPSLMDSLLCQSNVKSIPMMVAPILYTVLANVLAESSEVLVFRGLTRALNSVWASINRQLGPSRETVVGVATSCVNTPANKNLFAECRMPLVLASDSETDINSCCRILNVKVDLMPYHISSHKPYVK